MALAVIGVLLATPLLALGLALVRAVILAWPTMLVLGALHTHVPVVPAWGLVTTFWVVFAISLLVPTGTNASSN